MSKPASEIIDPAALRGTPAARPAGRRHRGPQQRRVPPGAGPARVPPGRRPPSVPDQPRPSGRDRPAAAPPGQRRLVPRRQLPAAPAGTTPVAPAQEQPAAAALAPTAPTGPDARPPSERNPARRPFRQADPASSRAASVDHRPSDPSATRRPAPVPPGGPALASRERPSPRPGDEPFASRLGQPSAAGRPAGEPAARRGRGLLASRRPVPAPRRRSSRWRPVRRRRRAPADRAVATRPAVPRGLREVALSGEDARPSGGRAGAAATWRSSSRSRSRPTCPSSAPVPDHEVIVERGSTPQQLGPRLNRSAGDVVRFLLLQGEMVTATQPLTDDMIDLFAAEIGAQIRLVDPGEEQEAALRAKFFGDERGRRGRGSAAAASGHHRHGPRRPRQDAAARPDPPVERRRRRGRWHHPAHRRLPGRVARPPA